MFFPSIQMFIRLILAFVVVAGSGVVIAQESDKDQPVPPRKNDSDVKKRADKIDRPHRGADYLRAFKEADVNKDGFLSIEEFSKMKRLARFDEAKKKRLFAYLDKNQDGKLHHRELHPQGPGRFSQIIKNFPRLDVDGSGGLSIDEMSKAPIFKKVAGEHLKRLFNKLDKNKNQELEKSELVRASQRGRPMIHFAKHDKDKSGGLSFEEYSAIPFMNRISLEKRKKIFDRIDVNGDQELSADEIRKAHHPQRKHDRHGREGSRNRKKGPEFPKQGGVREKPRIF